MMVESEAKELPEDVMLGAVMAGHDAMQPVIDMIIDLAEKAAKEPFEFVPEDYSRELELIQKKVGDDLSKAYQITEKLERQAAVAEAREKAADDLIATEEKAGEMTPEQFKAALQGSRSGGCARRYLENRQAD